MRADALNGQLDVLVLATLAEDPGHGYVILQRLRERSQGAFDLAEGTLYPALHRLERDGLLEQLVVLGQRASPPHLPAHPLGPGGPAHAPSGLEPVRPRRRGGAGMTWLDRLGDELAARGVGGRDRERILLELADHIACDPGCEARLGDPVQLAETFADELATGRARRGTWEVFGALVLTAVALVVSQVALGRLGYPGFDHGLSLGLFFPGLIGIFIAPQVALVAGTLAAVRCLRRRRAPRLAAAEIALIRRRAWIALGAGLATVVGLELHVIDFVRVLPAWWLTLTATLAAIAGLALLTAARELRSGGTVTSAATGPAGDVFDDLPLIRSAGCAATPGGSAPPPRWPWAWPSCCSKPTPSTRGWRACSAGCSRVSPPRSGSCSWAEPSESADPGRRPRPALLGSALTPADRLAGDEDRSRAELLLRESFATGRLELDELTSRLEAVHRARTLADLRAALTGLPPLPLIGQSGLATAALIGQSGLGARRGSTNGSSSGGWPASMWRPRSSSALSSAPNNRATLDSHSHTRKITIPANAP